ncbi:type I-F CRISPR-associated protein Csy2 [Pseudomonas entomophila]|uniref:type I-F CRISPR-associated protein Csy2 n=1 Tax=Pseudomonas entomophila TaxID=312306 RepID=UPI002406BE54|nr:type I-F CRISPR-associated protein Csy2 [Pseudomonas entomophila]MDF9619953.1 type I-F CRISPR-associated protein Csy2 [Pseudomonas entomophila]
MSELAKLEALLVLPHLRIQNANALSSPLTHGFPSITAFTGLMCALERKARAAGIDLRFPAVGVVVHQHEEQASSDRYVKALHLTRNPNDRNGTPSPIIEEGRIHLELTLLLGVKGAALDDPAQANTLARKLSGLLHSLRLAGGSFVPSIQPDDDLTPYFMPLSGSEDDRQEVFASTAPNWLPGFTLVERHDLLRQRQDELQNSQQGSTALDALLSLARINWRAGEPDASGKTAWSNDRQGLGWIVPIPVGFGALTPLLPAGSVLNARDSDTPMRMVESLYSIGEWLSPHRLESVEQLLWYPTACVESGLYRCRNDYQPDIEYNFD